MAAYITELVSRLRQTRLRVGCCNEAFKLRLGLKQYRELRSAIFEQNCNIGSSPDLGLKRAMYVMGIQVLPSNKLSEAVLEIQLLDPEEE